MWPILLCSLTAVAVIVNKAWQYRKVVFQLGMPLKDLRKARPEFMVPLLAAVDSGLADEETGLVGTRQIRRLERGLGTLSLVSVVSPLLGLTGTVIGMISAFQAVSEAGSRVEPALLAGGIWQALLTTAAGMMVAIVAHVGFHYLDNRMGEIALMMKEATMALKAEEEHGV